MTDTSRHIDPTYGLEACRPGAPASADLPMPKRIWSADDTRTDRLRLSCAFQAPSEGQDAVLWVTADGDFTAFVNTQELGRIEGNPLARRFERFDLGTLIKPGVNTIEMNVEPAEEGPHGLLAVLDVQIEGEPTRIISDETWSVSAMDDPSDPTMAATVVGDLGSEPWGVPAGGPDDLCRGSFGDLRQLPLAPREVLGAEPNAGRIERPEALTADDDTAATIDPGSNQEVVPPGVDLSKGWRYSHLRREEENRQNLAWLRDARQGRPTVLLDYGRTLNARLCVELAEPVTGTIAIITGESPEAVDHDDAAFCQVLQLREEPSAFTEITGMRYARVVFLASDRPMRVRSVTAEMVYYPVDHRGSFECSDPVLTRIWDVSAYTLHACMQDYVWDGIKRDQLPWMGDAHVEHLGIYYAFGDTALPRRTLAWLRWHGPPETSINGIDSYTLFWLSGLYDYLLFSGDSGFLTDQRDALRSLLESVEGLFEGGMYVGEDAFIDHAPIVGDEQNGQIAGTQMLAVRALKEASMLLGVLGDSNDAVRYIEMAGRIRAAAQSQYWRADAGDFGPYRQVNALAVFAGVADEEQIATTAERLASGQGNPMTTWQHYYLYEALAYAEKHQAALDSLRSYYGKMLDLGATTFWETYDEAWQGPDVHSQLTTHLSYSGYRISLCHGWASGPLAWLSDHVLGVRPQRPGFVHCRIQPRPLDLTWFKGDVPTPHGEIHIDAEQSEGAWRLVIDVPQGIQPNLDVSYIEPLGRLVLNGQEVELE